MARRMRLSDRNVSRLRVERSEYSIWDTRIIGLGVRVRPSGFRTFVFLDSRDCSSKRRTPGPVTLMGVEEARARCLEMQTGSEKTPKQVRSTAVGPLFPKVHSHFENNPASGIRRNPGQQLTRFLSRDEIIRLHKELDRCVAEKRSRAAQAEIIRLLFFTGCRYGEAWSRRPIGVVRSRSGI